MKFGQNLLACVYEPWLPHYIDYAALKALIAAGCPAAAFLAALRRELATAEAFLEATWPALTRPLEHLDAHGALPQAAFLALCQDLGHVREFMLLNYLAALKIAKKHDKRSPGPHPAVALVTEWLQGPGGGGGDAGGGGGGLADAGRLGALLLRAEGLACNLLASAPPRPAAPMDAGACPRCAHAPVQVAELWCRHALCGRCLAEPPPGVPPLDHANHPEAPSAAGPHFLRRCGHAWCVQCAPSVADPCAWCDAPPPPADPAAAAAGRPAAGSLSPLSPERWQESSALQELRTSKRDVAWLQEEMEKAKYLGWLEGIGSLAEEAAAAGHRESATTAFWRALAVRHDRLEADRQMRRVTVPIARPVPPPSATRAAALWAEPLAHLGRLVDDMAAVFQGDAHATHAAVLYLLRLAGWPVHLCHPRSQSPLASTPFLRVTPPLGPSAAKVPTFIVDLSFGPKFQVARQSRRLTGLLRSLPQAFVGTEECLARAIHWCTSVVQESFLLLGMAIPPWRTLPHLQQFYTVYDCGNTDALVDHLDGALHLLAQSNATALPPKTSPLTAKTKDVATRLLRVLRDALRTPSEDAAADSEEGETQPSGAGPGSVAPFLSPVEVRRLLRHLADPTVGPCPGASCISPSPDGASEFEKSRAPAPDPGPGASSLTQLLAHRWGAHPHPHPPAAAGAPVAAPRVARPNHTHAVYAPCGIPSLG